MTDDKITITRRFAFPADKNRDEQKFEFYNIEWVTKDTAPGYHGHIIDEIEKRVQYIKDNVLEPSPEISPKIAPSTKEQKDPYSDHLIYDGDTVRTKHFIHNKDTWGEINTHLKGLGYKWVSDGENSRWER